MILNFDPYKDRLAAVGTLVKWKPYKESFITLADFSVTNLPSPVSEEPPDFLFEGRSNQIRALIGYGDLTRRGFNATFGASYDVTEEAFQNQIAEVSYNGSCCEMCIRDRSMAATITSPMCWRELQLLRSRGSRRSG